MMRRDMLAASLAALTVAPVVAQAAQPDPILDLCAQYQHAYDMMEVALANDTSGNFDSPECGKWNDEKDRLMKVIEVTPIKSREGLAAFCAFLWTDADANNCEWLDVQRWALVKMRDYAEARALVGIQMVS